MVEMTGRLERARGHLAIIELAQFECLHLRVVLRPQHAFDQGMFRGCTSSAPKACGRLAFEAVRHIRAYSASSERVDVPCRSNGSISLDIYHPRRSTTRHTDAASVLLYLPRGPLAGIQAHDASIVSTLRSHLASTIVQVNYRLDDKHQYPTPVHDVLAGYDWVRKQLLPQRAITRAGRSKYVGKLAVFGELIGGGLAAALALTECRIGEVGVVAAALNNPIVDWVSLGHGERAKTAKADSIMTDKSALDLHKAPSLRPQLFAKPEAYFDPFASPILFFRSAGVDVPPAPATVPTDDMGHLSMLEREAYLQSGASRQGVGISINQNTVSEPTAIKRKATRRYPSSASGLRLPLFHISAGQSSPFAGQTTEFVRLLRRSFARQGTSETSEFGRKELVDDEDDQLVLNHEVDKAILNLYDGLALWDDSPAGKLRLLETAKWLRGRLE